MTMLLPTLVVAAVMSGSMQFKLSDLPPLKRWEIPTHIHTGKNVGRKYKDFDNIEVKRSHYWEAKPDFTAKEIDWYDDPETVKLDYNYKNFLDNPDESALKEEVSASLVKKDKSNLLGLKRDMVVKKPIDDDFNIIDNSFVRSLITPQNISTHNILAKKLMKKRKHKKIAKKERHRRSSEDSKYDGIFSENNSGFVSDTTDALDIFDERNKRDIISEFLNEPRGLGNKKSAVSAKDSVKNEQATKKENIQKIEQSRKTAEQILKSKKITEGVLGDEQPVSKNTIADAVKMQKIASKPQDVKATTRERIDHPKDKFNMDSVPSNVARAVAMAMEQLKRDKMWGKVFVHVRPSGQLKVMVQETRKMEDESSRKKK